MNILDYIPKGYNKAVSREYLRTILHISDRKVRKLIEHSTEQIFWCDGGYFRHKSIEDIPYEEDYLRQEQARSRAMIRKCRKIKAAIYG